RFVPVIPSLTAITSHSVVRVSYSAGYTFPLMLKELVSLLIAVGTLGGGGTARATAVPTLDVTATAPTPPAFIKFLREYFNASPLVLLVVFLNQELNGLGGRPTRPGRSSSEERQTRILARAAWRV